MIVLGQKIDIIFGFEVESVIETKKGKRYKITTELPGGYKTMTLEFDDAAIKMLAPELKEINE